MDHQINQFQEDAGDAIKRREFLKQITVSGGTLAFVFLPSIPANADQVSPDDARLQTEMITYPGKSGDIQGYLAKPRKSDELPAVIIIHENRGLQPHIKDVTRRMALEGFLALAPDALSPLGGTPEDENIARIQIREMDDEVTKSNFVAAVQYLKTHPNSTGKVGCTGFCWGGSMTNQVAVHSPDLAAAVPYYGGQPADEDVHKIKAVIMAHYGELDERINAGIPAFEAALKKASIDYQIFIYKGAGHAFNNDTNPARYNKEAAELAWKRTVDFFREKLKE